MYIRDFHIPKYYLIKEKNAQRTIASDIAKRVSRKIRQSNFYYSTKALTRSIEIVLSTDMKKEERRQRNLECWNRNWRLTRAEIASSADWLAACANVAVVARISEKPIQLHANP